ncbi:hypothetical protein Tco_1578980, partial [Tanacetum coccineum]
CNSSIIDGSLLPKDIPIEGWMMMENKHCGELMIENHWMGKLLKEVFMIDELSIVETDKVNHTVEMDMLKLVVEVECFESMKPINIGSMQVFDQLNISDEFAPFIRKCVQKHGMDKSKITRKQSKVEQARTRESKEYKAEARKAKPQSLSSHNKPQGPILQFPKVIYNLKEIKGRQGSNV